MFKQIMGVVPGFRTGRLWKKILACIIYFFLIITIIALIASNSSSISSLDNAILKSESLALIFFLILVPFILITNLGNIRGKLPLFRSGSLLKKIMAWTISIVFIVLGLAFTNSYLSSKHSPEYIAYQKRLSEEKAIEEARKNAKKEAEKKVKQAREAEEKEKMEAKKAQQAKEAEDMAISASAEEINKQEEKKTKIAQEKKEQTLNEPKKQADSGQESKENEISSKTNSLSGWFSGLFGNSEAKDSNKTAKNIIKSFEHNLEKGKSEKILEIYNSSDKQMKDYIEERINEEYLKKIKENKELLLSSKSEIINKFYNQISFINDIPKLKDSELGKTLAEIKDLIEANNKLEKFEKDNPKLNFGIIKDSAEVQDVECYVNYRIKNSGTKIGDFTIQNESYTDMYFISSYTYNQFLGYTSSDDWGAVLKLSADSKITKAGVYRTKAVSIGTTKLIDSNGFNNEYPMYREISQQDIDKYNQVKDLIDKKNELNDSIDKFKKKLSTGLS